MPRFLRRRVVPRTGRVFLGISSDDHALGGDDFAGEDVVAGQPVFAHQPSDAATKRQAADACLRVDAGRDGQAMQMGFAIDIAQ
jgi:hypothetical protein